MYVCVQVDVLFRLMHYNMCVPGSPKVEFPESGGCPSYAEALGAMVRTASAAEAGSLGKPIVHTSGLRCLHFWTAVGLRIGLLCL